jgi:hypothetical protein
MKDAIPVSVLRSLLIESSHRGRIAGICGYDPNHYRLSGERDHPGRIRRRPADGTLPGRQFHPFVGNSCLSLMICDYKKRAEKNFTGVGVELKLPIQKNN